MKEYIEAWTSKPPPTEVQTAFDKLHTAIRDAQGIYGTDIEFVWNTAKQVEALASAVNHGNCAIEQMINLLDQAEVKVPKAPPVASPPAKSTSAWGWALGVGTFAVLSIGVYYGIRSYNLQRALTSGE